MQIRNRPLPYVEALPRRHPAEIDLVVIHCTELPDLDEARRFGERILYPASGTGNSGHWYLDRDGSCELWVPPERIAWHVRGWNGRSVGIELVNLGRYPDWLDSRRQMMNEPYPEPQIDALIALLRQLRAELPSLNWIAGHEDLDTEQVPASDDPSVLIARKRDPGPLFPWSRVLEASPLRRLLPES